MQSLFCVLRGVELAYNPRKTQKKVRGLKASHSQNSYLGGRWDSNPRHSEPHIHHIINKLQQQPKNTFQKGLQVRAQLLLFEQRYTKYVNNKIPDN